MVKLDPHLHKCVFGKGKEEIEEVTWDKVFGGVQAKTNPAYSIQFPGQHPHIRKVFFYHFLLFFKYSQENIIRTVINRWAVGINTV